MTIFVLPQEHFKMKTVTHNDEYLPDSNASVFSPQENLSENCLGGPIGDEIKTMFMAFATAYHQSQPNLRHRHCYCYVVTLDGDRLS